MSAFQEMVASDIDNVFLNLDEFGEKHKIDRATITCCLQDAELNAVNNLRFMSESTLRMYAREADLPKRRNPGQTVHIDGVGHTVVTWKVEMGMVIAEFTHEEVR